MHTLDSVSFLARPARQTRVARYFLACYLLVILIVSFYPFGGWRHTGAPVFAFFTYPLPHYATFVENLVNILAYVPLGMCLTLLRRRRVNGVFLSLLSGVLLSSSVEFVQQFLPGRVASNLDIVCNGSGALLGGLLICLLMRRSWQRSWMWWRYQLFAPGAATEWGIAWLALWFVTQFDPSQPFLGVVVSARGLPQPFESPIANAALFLRLLEIGGMALNLIGTALFVSVLMRHVRQVPRAIGLTLFLALLLKMSFAGMLLKPSQFFAWLNLNIVAGGLLGGVGLLVFWRLRRTWRALLGAATLSASVLVAWFWPLSTQFSALLPLFRWHYGHLQHFSGLSGIVADLWPLVAAAWLLYIALRKPVEEVW